MPASDVSDTVGKQKPMGFELTGAFWSLRGRRVGYEEDYDKGLSLACGEEERERMRGK